MKTFQNRRVPLSHREVTPGMPLPIHALDQRKRASGRSTPVRIGGKGVETQRRLGLPRRRRTNLAGQVPTTAARLISLRRPSSFAARPPLRRFSANIDGHRRCTSTATSSPREVQTTPTVRHPLSLSLCSSFFLMLWIGRLIYVA